MKGHHLFLLRLWVICAIVGSVAPVYGQYFLRAIDSISMSKAIAGAPLTQGPVVPINLAGTINALVVPVGFPDKPLTIQYPAFVYDQYFTPLGVDLNGNSLSQLITQNNGSYPYDQWYGAGLNHYFVTESGGAFTVNFQFLKKSNGTRYQTTDNFSTWGNVYANYSAILNQVAQNMYNDNHGVFSGIAEINFTFEGLTETEFWNGDYGGTVSTNFTLTGTNGQFSWTGPVSIQWDCKNVLHEFMHVIGAAAGYPSGFTGFPDRGYDRPVSDGSTYLHNNMAYHYDIMEHNSSDYPSQYSLYGMKPLTSRDLIFLGWIQPDEILSVDQSNYTNYSDIKLADVNYVLTSQQKANGFHRIVKIAVPGQSNEYFLAEYHAASEYDKMFNNYDEYQNGGYYNTGVLIWHIKEIVNIDLTSDNPAELVVAVPYNSWYGNPTPNDNYPAHGNFGRASVPGYPCWNGIYSGDFNYQDDSRQMSSGGDPFVYFPDGGRHIWETTLVNKPGWSGWNATQESGTITLKRLESMKSDFFSDSNVKGHVTNSMTDGTRPSSREWGVYTTGPVANKTHIAITNITRQSGYMSLRVYYNAYDGTVTENTTISGNATIAGNLVVNPGITLTIASGTTLNFLSGSSLTVNGTLVSNVALTIPLGITMTVNPGASITFPSGNFGLNVNGILNANGSSASPISIDFTAPYVYGANGIFFHSGSGGSLSYCNIKHATYGVYSSNSVSSIHNCTITYCNVGVSCIGLPSFDNNTVSNNQTGVSISTTDMGSEICGNVITNNSSDGLCLYHVMSRSGAAVSYNTISNNGGKGVWCQNGSTPYMWYNTITGNQADGLHCENSPAHFGTQYGDPAHNVVRQNTGYGVYAYASNVYMGDVDTHYGMNSIYNNTSYEVYAAGNSTVLAKYNFWNVSTYPYYNPNDLHAESGSSINPFPGLSWDPNSGRQGAAQRDPSIASLSQAGTSPEINATQGVSGDTTVFDSDFEAALDQMEANNFQDAIAMYAKKYEKETNLLKKLYALEQLATCSMEVDSTTAGRAYAEQKFIAFLNEEVRPSISTGDLLYAKSLELESVVLLDQGQYVKALAPLIALKNNYTDPGIQKYALFNLAYIYCRLLNNYSSGKEYLAELQSGYPNDDLTNCAERLLIDPGNASVSSDFAAKTGEAASAKLVDEPIGFGNYPNPFNPTTVITYDVPKSGHVTLKVYDILGREVATLVNNVQTAGPHSAQFKGDNLASGIYIYRLTLNGTSQVKKMLLMK